MKSFYTIGHNSFATRGFPWAQEIVRGLELAETCYGCSPEGRRIHRVSGEVHLALESGKGTRWPDVLGCGHWSLFIVATRVIEDWRAIGIEDPPTSPVRIVEPLPKRLAHLPPPAYVWLDGSKMVGGRVDFAASGFVGVSFCPECGTRLEDHSATYERQRSATYPIAVVEESYSGAKVFTTDLSPAAFFCTHEVVALARAKRHTNFKFVPGEMAGSSTSGIKYM